MSIGMSDGVKCNHWFDINTIDVGSDHVDLSHEMRHGDCMGGEEAGCAESR
jgi:hypothetical protein